MSEASCSRWKQLLFFSPTVPPKPSCCSNGQWPLRDIWMKPVVPAENRSCSLHQLFLLIQAAVLKDSDLALKDIWVKPVVPAENSRCFFTPTVPPWPCPKWQLGEAVYFWWQYLLFLLNQAAVLNDAPVTLPTFARSWLFRVKTADVLAVPLRSSCCSKETSYLKATFVREDALQSERRKELLKPIMYSRPAFFVRPAAVTEPASNN